MLMVAMVLLAAAPVAEEKQPWVGMSAGPVLLRQSGRPGVGSGPLVRVEVGYPLADRVAAEVWLTGAMESAPLGTPGDRALLGAGAGARVLVSRLDSSGKLGLWMHGGAGWGAPIAGDGQHGPTGFAGLLLSFQPFVKRFTLGLETDAVAWRSAVGIAILPSLRCTF
jgi:hypothetical protein